MSILKPKKSRKDEVIGLVLIILGILVLISLITHDQRDLVGGSDIIFNRIGVVGAYSSFAIFYLFGYPAYLLPLILAALGVTKFRGRDNFGILINLSGFLLTLIALCALLSLIFHPQEGASASQHLSRFSWGGSVGLLLSDMSVKILGLVGSYILAGAVILLSVILYTNISMAKVTLFGIDKLKRLGEFLREQWKESRKRAAERREQKGLEGDVFEAEEDRLAMEEVPPPPPDRGEREEFVFVEEAVKPPPSKEPAEGIPQVSLPPIDLITSPESTTSTVTDQERRKKAKIINATLREYGTDAKVVSIGQSGPRLTLFEVELGTGQRVSGIGKLEIELALALKVDKVRIAAGSGAKGTIGIEVPNERERLVTLREIVEDKIFRKSDKPLPIALGLTMDGKPAIFDLSAMPHLLIAGATGSGKSVFLNSIIMSLIFRFTPRDVRFILIDQKQVELGIYHTKSAALPHLLFEVIKSADGATNSLGWCVQEMEARYQLLADTGARNIEGYNAKMSSQPAEQLLEKYNSTGFHPTLSIPQAKLPYIILLIDELGDLMSIKGRLVEDPLTRLAQMARAVGIHLVVATQRPSVDVITGLIKANFPTRLSFQVSSKIDSRTILDRNGAENLLGKGDFLFLPIGVAEPIRMQAPYVSPEEIATVVNYLFGDSGEYRPPPIGEVEWQVQAEEEVVEEGEGEELLEEARQIVIREKQASISLLQRKLSIGYARAGRLIDLLEKEGVVGPSRGSKPRKVLISTPDIPPGGKETV